MRAMKKIFFAFLFLSVCIAAYSQDKPQIPNGDFETWTFDGGSLPNNWNSFQTADGSLAGTAYKASDPQIARSTDTRPGSTGDYSCMIWAREIKVLFVKVVAQGNLTSGRIHADAMSATGKDNYNYSDTGSYTTDSRGIKNPCAMEFHGMPDSLVAWVKFVPADIDKEHPYAMLNAYIHDDFDFIEGYAKESPSSHIVAYTETAISSCGGEWQRISLPFEYLSNRDPQYILINIATNTYPGGGSEGDELYIDDIEMIYNPTSFELSMPRCGWSSLYLDYDAEVPEGATAYYATSIAAGYVTLEEIPEGKSIPAYNAVLISSSESSLTFAPSSSSLADLSDNILSGSIDAERTESGYDYYVLSGDATTKDTPSFAIYQGSYLSENKAFIKVRR